MSHGSIPIAFPGFTDGWPVTNSEGFTGVIGPTLDFSYLLGISKIVAHLVGDCIGLPGGANLTARIKLQRAAEMPTVLGSFPPLGANGLFSLSLDCGAPPVGAWRWMLSGLTTSGSANIKRMTFTLEMQ